MKKTALFLLAFIAASAAFAPRADAFGIIYNFHATLSGGVSVDGQFTVESTNAGYVPGGTVDWFTGGITSYKLVASNGSTTETIDSNAGAQTPQTLKITFSSGSFPSVAFWDMSVFGSSVPPEFASVRQPADAGFDQWAGTQLNGSSFPSSGAWTLGTVPTKAESWGKLKSIYR